MPRSVPAANAALVARPPGHTGSLLPTASGVPPTAQGISPMATSDLLLWPGRSWSPARRRDRRFVEVQRIDGRLPLAIGREHEHAGMRHLILRFTCRGRPCCLADQQVQVKRLAGGSCTAASSPRPAPSRSRSNSQPANSEANARSPKHRREVRRKSPTRVMRILESISTYSADQ